MLLSSAMTTREFPTLAERKAARVAFLHEAVAALRNRLREYARSHGGRFLLYGSAARGDLRFDSDIDMLIEQVRALSTEGRVRAPPDEHLH